MKELIANILTVFFISAPIVSVLAIGFITLKCYGDLQRDRYERDKQVYDDKYLFIQVLISTMQVSDANYKNITLWIETLEGLSYKNREKTDALYRSLDRRFKEDELIEKNLKEAFYEV